MRNLLVLLLLATPVKAEWVTAVGQEHYNSSIAEKVACQAAQDKAIAHALQQAAGEFVISSRFQVCDDRDSETCRLVSSSMVTSEGLVTGIRNISQHVTPRLCTVSLQANVEKDNTPTDNNFDPDVRIVQNKLYNGDYINIKVKSLQPLYLHLFVYSPYEEEPDQLKLIYPNSRQPGRKLTQAAIPSDNYKMVVRFPKNTTVALASEVLIAVATKEEATFRQQFTLTEFNARLKEIPKKDRRVINMPYFVWAAQTRQPQ